MSITYMEVTYMNEENFNQNTQQENEVFTEGTTSEVPHYTSVQAPQRPFMMQEPENVPMGILGALLFSLVGGVLYFIVYQLGYIAGIAGFVAVICAVKGYKLLGKRESVKGVIISVIVSVVVILLAATYSVSFSLLESLKSFYPSQTVTVLNSPIYLLRAMKDSGDITRIIVSELAIALLLCIVAAGSSVTRAIKSAKANNQ